MNAHGKSALHFVRYLFGWDEALTQTTALEQQALARHAAGRERLVEIGVYEGFNTRRLAEAMAADGELFAIDPFPTGRLGVSWCKLIAQREAAKLNPPRRVRFVEEFSYEANKQLHGEFDFIFIDGDHSFEGIKQDWCDWSCRLPSGGIIALHDSIVPDHNPAWAEPGSCAFFESHIRPDTAFEILQQAGSLSVLRRK